MNEKNRLIWLDWISLAGVPLYTTTQSEVKGRFTDLETFNFIDSLLNVAIPNLPLKETLGGMENGSIHRATGAVLLAKLYLLISDQNKFMKFLKVNKKTLPL